MCGEVHAVRYDGSQRLPGRIPETGIVIARRSVRRNQWRSHKESRFPVSCCSSGSVPTSQHSVVQGNLPDTCGGLCLADQLLTFSSVPVFIATFYKCEIFIDPTYAILKINVTPFKRDRFPAPDPGVEEKEVGWDVFVKVVVVLEDLVVKGIEL